MFPACCSCSVAINVTVKEAHAAPNLLSGTLSARLFIPTAASDWQHRRRAERLSHTEISEQVTAALSCTWMDAMIQIT